MRALALSRSIIISLFVLVLSLVPVGSEYYVRFIILGPCFELMINDNRGSLH